MNRKQLGFFVLFVVLTSLLFNGCAGIPSKEKITSLNYGNPPKGNYKTKAKDFFKSSLKDPDSAQYVRWEEPVRFWVTLMALNSPLYLAEKQSAYTPLAGYMVFVWINAKNGFGGYSGAQRYGVLFKNDAIVAAFQPESTVAHAGILTSEGAPVSCTQLWDSFLHCP